MKPVKKKNMEVANEDVEELIKAAEDALLLKINANVHTVHAISPDLLSSSSLLTNVQQNMKPKKNKKNPEIVNEEVEELLRASEDTVLLKLNANSHTVHGSSSDLHPDLHGRFQALKSGSKNTKRSDLLTKRAPTSPPPPPQDDDLYSRFAALKATLPNPYSCNSLRNASKLPPGVDNIDDDDEDEVEKVIRWAKDSARLDPSPPSDEDDDTKDDDSYGDSEVSDEDEDEDEDDDLPKKDQKARKK